MNHLNRPVVGIATRVAGASGVPGRHRRRHRTADAADVARGTGSAPPLTALFTSTSAVCVTGLIVEGTLGPTTLIEQFAALT